MQCEMRGFHSKKTATNMYHIDIFELNFDARYRKVSSRASSTLETARAIAISSSENGLATVTEKTPSEHKGIPNKRLVGKAENGKWSETK